MGDELELRREPEIRHGDLRPLPLRRHELEDFRSGTVSADAIVSAAYSQLGVPYVWGGTTPGVGLDCSGLTQYCYRQAGISIPRNTESQYAQGQEALPVGRSSRATSSTERGMSAST